MKKILNSLLITLFLILVSATATLADAPQNYIDNSTGTPVQKTAPTGTNIKQLTSADTTLATGWYYIDNNIDMETSYFTVTGEVNVIISNSTDGYKEYYLNTQATDANLFEVSSSGSITFYAEKTPEYDGVQTALSFNFTNGNNEPAFGPVDNAFGTVIFNSGYFNVYGGTGTAVVGGTSTPAGNFDIYGSGVTFSSGTSTSFGSSDSSINLNVYGGAVMTQAPSTKGNGVGAGSINNGTNGLTTINGSDAYVYASGYSPDADLVNGIQSTFDPDSNTATSQVKGNATVPPMFYDPSGSEDGTTKSNWEVEDNSSLTIPEKKDGQNTNIDTNGGSFTNNGEVINEGGLKADEFNNNGTVTLRDGSTTDIEKLNNEGKVVKESGADLDYDPDQSEGDAPLEIPSVIVPENSNQGIYNITLGTTTPVYYATNSEQSVNIGLNVTSVPANEAFANSLTWILNSVTEEGSDINFTANDWTVEPEKNSTYMTLTSNDGSFIIKQEIKTVGSKEVPGNTYLVYTGENTAIEGVYNLVATAKTGTWPTGVYTEAPNASLRVIVNETENIEKVTITNLDGSATSNPVTFNIDQTTSARFGYKAINEDEEPVTGNVIEWSLSYSGNNGDYSNVAYLNSKTGQITFYQPTGDNYLILSVTVDGQKSNNLLIKVTGTETELEGIAPLVNPVYAVNDDETSTVDFILANNIVSVPYGLSLNGSSNTTTTLEFTSSNPNILIYNNETIVTSSIGYVGSTTITATYKEYNSKNQVIATYTTNFILNLVPEEIAAEGISVTPELTFVYGETGSQNVDARLMPETTTEQTTVDTFSYESSDDSVATVTPYGEVYATGMGDAVIYTTATIDGEEVTEETIVTVSDEYPVTEITLTPDNILLNNEEEGRQSATITATLTPASSTQVVTWSISPETVATLVDNGDNTATVTAVSDGEATVTATIGDVTATAKVTVTTDDVVVGSVEITSDDPSYFTVTAYNVQSMVEGETPQYLALFAWSTSTQSDINAKPMTHIEGTDNWVVENIPVNDTPINNYFDIADSITLNMYGSNDPDDNGQEIWSGSYSWVNAQNIGDNSVAYIGYSQNLGFVHPTAFDGEQAGTTQQALQMEGLRVSSGIEGVQIEANVHVQDYGWLGYVADGTYAGTMHENKQMEAVQLRLVGDNAANYTLRYRAHVQDYGWLDWVTTGQTAGTTDQFLQMEAIQIELVPVDAAN